MEIIRGITTLAPGLGPAETPLAPVRPVSRVTPGDGADGQQPQSRRTPGQAQAAAEARDVAALRREMEQRALPPGPPPAFAVNILELDRELQQVMARIEALHARTGTGNAPPTAVDADVPAPSGGEEPPEG